MYLSKKKFQTYTVCPKKNIRVFVKAEKLIKLLGFQRRGNVVILYLP